MTLKKYLGLTTAIAVGGFVIACSSSSNNNNPPSTPTDGGTVKDSGGTHPVDSGSGSGSGGTTDGGTCSPSDESSYTPTWHPPKPHTTSCDQAQIDSYIQCQKDAQTAPAGTTPASCAPWGSKATGANATCETCIESKESDAQWGALIIHADNTVSPNVAGCIAVAEGKTDGSGCGGQVQAADSCEETACTANCPVDAQGNGLDALNACIQAAGQGTCSKFQTPADNCTNVDSGPITACFPTSANAGFWDVVGAAAAVICGGGSGAGDAATGG